MIVPGTIVVIDNNVDRAEERMVEELRKQGESVLCYNEFPQNFSGIITIRLAIVDFNLSGSTGPAVQENSLFVVENLTRISEISSFYLIVIWTVNADDEDLKKEIKEKIIAEYNSRNLKNLDKENIIVVEKVEGSTLIEIINEWIGNNKNACLIYEWEKGIEVAKKPFVEQIYDNNIIKIVREISKEYGVENSYELISNLFIRILSRNLFPLSEKFKESIDKISINPQIASGAPPSDEDMKWYSSFYNLQSYYHIENTSIITGDLFSNPNDSEGFEYRLIINPLCDFIQKKVDRLKYIKGRKLDYIPDYDNSNYDSIPNFIKDFCWKTYHKQGLNIIKSCPNRDNAINMLFSNSIKDRYYPLYFLKDIPEEEYYHIYLDFCNIANEKIEINESYFYDKPDEWVYVCHIDTPILEDILQKYSSYSNRIGIASITPEFLDKERQKYRDNKE